MAAAVESWTAAAPEPEAGEHRVTSLELFFDLVFVFAITQVTAMLVADPTWGGLARGMLVLAALWWAWVGYAWLTNTIDPDIVVNRLTVFASMAAVLVVSLAVPGAFAGDATLFAAAYLLVRVVHLALYARGSHDRAEWAAVARLAPTATIAPLLLLLASAFDGALQGAIWIAALLIDYSGPLRIRGWRVDAGHFAERHGLIILIALGESLVALGVGARELELSAAAIAAAVLGITALSALWWAYFDVVAIVAERRLRAATGD